MCLIYNLGPKSGPKSLGLIRVNKVAFNCVHVRAAMYRARGCQMEPEGLLMAAMHGGS